nr:MAG: capsid protein precursor [Bamboo rat astrovirus]WEU70889.1 MAG: capsid protein precursor [Bamboo rat astrovirus]WFD49990.1 capsid protein [Bamboo rat astrovirus]
MSGQSANCAGARPKNTNNKVTTPQAKQSKPKQSKQKQKFQQKQNRRTRTGPKRSRGVVNSVTVTLGTIGSNQGGTVEPECCILLNPLTLKDTTGSNALGPLQVSASQYSNYRIIKCHLKLTPLVGPNAATGTVIRASFNSSSTPGQNTWSALGARKHRDTHIGKSLNFSLNKRDFHGLGNGGIFFTSTGQSPLLTFPGTLEVHTLGKTSNPYKNEDYQGELFLAELSIVFYFTNYNLQLGLLNLQKGVTNTLLRFVNIDGKAGVEIQNPPAAMVNLETNTTGAGEIIWQMVNTAASTIADVLPAPFNWLAKAGWWFVKTAIGKTGADGTAQQFLVYQSMQDAMDDKPMPAPSLTEQQSHQVSLQYQQITPRSVVINDVPSNYSVQPTPPTPQPPPPRDYSLFYQLTGTRGVRIGQNVQSYSTNLVGSNRSNAPFRIKYNDPAYNIDGCIVIGSELKTLTINGPLDEWIPQNWINMYDTNNEVVAKICAYNFAGPYNVPGHTSDQHKWVTWFFLGKTEKSFHFNPTPNGWELLNGAQTITPGPARPGITTIFSRKLTNLLPYTWDQIDQGDWVIFYQLAGYTANPKWQIPTTAITLCQGDNGNWMYDDTTDAAPVAQDLIQGTLLDQCHGPVIWYELNTRKPGMPSARMAPTDGLPHEQYGSDLLYSIRDDPDPMSDDSDFLLSDPDSEDTSDAEDWPTVQQRIAVLNRAAEQRRERLL